MIITRELLCPKNRVCSDPGFTFNPRIVSAGALTVRTLLISVLAGLLPAFLSSLSTLNTSSSNVISPPFTGVPYASPPVGVRWHVRFWARSPSSSDPSESFSASLSAAYRQARPDFWHCEHGHERSHLSLRLRHSVHDLTGRGRLTLRDCCGGVCDRSGGWTGWKGREVGSGMGTGGGS